MPRRRNAELRQWPCSHQMTPAIVCAEWPHRFPWCTRLLKMPNDGSPNVSVMTANAVADSKVTTANLFGALAIKIDAKPHNDS